MVRLVEKCLSSPLGVLRLVATDDALAGVYFADHRPPPALIGEEVTSHEVLDLAARELGEYFRGERLSFSTPIQSRGTEFQQLVWSGLRAIPFGERWSYRHLASFIGHPGATRAVGSANARNPLSILVPCHRVVRADGDLCGYAGGVAAKKWLLAHELRRSHLRAPAPPGSNGTRARPTPTSS